MGKLRPSASANGHWMFTPPVEKVSPRPAQLVSIGWLNLQKEIYKSVLKFNKFISHATQQGLWEHIHHKTPL